MKIYLAGANLNRLDRKFEEVFQEKDRKLYNAAFEVKNDRAQVELMCYLHEKLCKEGGQLLMEMRQDQDNNVWITLES
jgi:hypothetical protein